MDNEQEARNAIRALNSQILNGSRINVEVCVCDLFDL